MSPTRVLREPRRRAPAQHHPDAGPGPAEPVRRAADRARYSEWALTRGRRVAFWALTVVWVAVVARFWLWWLEPSHRGVLGLYLAASVPLLYPTTVLPSFYWFFVGRMRRPVHTAPTPGRRVALITLCVPSRESLDVIAGQLARDDASVHYPHDSWSSTRAPRPRSRALAHKHGVHYFTRRGEPTLEPTGPPFQAKTKAGNVNAWLDPSSRSRARLRGLRPARHRPSP